MRNRQDQHQHKGPQGSTPLCRSARQQVRLAHSLHTRTLLLPVYQMAKTGQARANTKNTPDSTRKIQRKTHHRRRKGGQQSSECAESSHRKDRLLGPIERTRQVCRRVNADTLLRIIPNDQTGRPSGRKMRKTRLALNLRGFQLPRIYPSRSKVLKASRISRSEQPHVRRTGRIETVSPDSSSSASDSHSEQPLSSSPHPSPYPPLPPS